jgi:hypothetical protein
MKQKTQTIWTDMAEKWPSAFVARQMISDFTGGLVAPGTMANADSAGDGPEERIIYRGKKVAYRVKPLIVWLDNRSTIATPKMRKRGGQ